jgi:hypothetical protein
MPGKDVEGGEEQRLEEPEGSEKRSKKVPRWLRAVEWTAGSYRTHDLDKFRTCPDLFSCGTASGP